jgi:hypothetical protein
METGKEEVKQPISVKLLFVIFGLLINFGLAMHQYIMFIRAYMSPQKAIVLYIDVFHEANAELVLLTLSMVVGLIATAYILWCIRNRKRIIN